MAFLVWITSEGEQVLELEGEVSIGRSSRNTVPLGDARVSKFHARIDRREGNWVFEDLGSSNGSSINGRAETFAALEEGDVIEVGRTVMKFRTSLDEEGGIVGGGGRPEGVDRLRACTIAAEWFPDDPEMSPVSVVKSDDAGVSDARDVPPEELVQRLKACYEVSKATAATLDLSETLDRVLGALFEIFETAERAFVVLDDTQTGQVGSAASKSRGGTDTEVISISRTALKQAMEERQAVLCGDAMSDKRYASAESIVTLGIRSLMIAPLVFQDEVLGAIHVDTRGATGQFTQGDLQLLSAAAAQIAGCVANSLIHTKLVASERLAAVGQTVAGLTHCIKNILQGIKGGVYIVDKALESDNEDRLNAGWSMVKRNNAFMEELVFDLLSYSKEREPVYETADLNVLCGEVCELAAARGKAKGVEVEFEGDADLGEIEIDPKGIRRSILNLVTNAVDACMKTQGGVTVETNAPGVDGLARVIIRDTGCGMPEEVKAKLFTVFFSTKGSKGTGLGLPVTKKIIEEHKGSIEVRSQEGKGTTFTVSLPASRDDREENGG